MSSDTQLRLPNGKIVLTPGNKQLLANCTLSVLQEIKTRSSFVCTWAGVPHSEEQKICKKYRIPFIPCKDMVKNPGVLLSFITETFRWMKIFRKEKPIAIFTFSNRRSLPLLTAAKLKSVPYFLHEPEAIPSPVSRIFAAGARRTFLGFPISESWRFGGEVEFTGTPVPTAKNTYDQINYPKGFDRTRKCIVIRNDFDHVNDHFVNICIKVIPSWLDKGYQIIFVTGEREFKNARSNLKGRPGLFLLPDVHDIYPYYAQSKLIICGGSSVTLSEAAYFGLPCITISKKYGAEKTQWVNAGIVESQGWGVRIHANSITSGLLNTTVVNFMSDQVQLEKMSRAALDQAPFNAAARITGTILEEVLN